MNPAGEEGARERATRLTALLVVSLALCACESSAPVCIGGVAPRVPAVHCFAHRDFTHYEDACKYDWRAEVPIWSSAGRANWRAWQHSDLFNTEHIL